MSEPARLIRGLSLLDSILLLAGGIIGSGIFLTAADVSSNTRTPVLFLSIWVIGMVITMLACFAFAEMGAMFPEAGGQYIYLREAYGDLVAFLYGWMIFTVSVGGTIAALGAGFAEYAGKPCQDSQKDVCFPRFTVSPSRERIWSHSRQSRS